MCKHVHDIHCIRACTCIHVRRPMYVKYITMNFVFVIIIIISAYLYICAGVFVIFSVNVCARARVCDTVCVLVCVCSF